jgi:hypothetical protein
LVQIPLDEKNILAPVVNDQAPWSIASAVQISPDGQWLAATANRYDAPFYGGVHTARATHGRRGMAGSRLSRCHHWRMVVVA